ncbi:MAG: four helix bundle protein [Bacteroidaceae bacterium]|nr:four helix bundle protein [Bacteroidaceae bacterium]
MQYSFETLKAWQEAKKLVVTVYRLIEDFPKFEKYALCDQIRRAIVSVPSNLAEGSGRISLKEQIRFIEISYGSLMEAYNQLLIAADLEYIDKQSIDSIKPDIDTVARLLNGLRASYVKKSNEENENK